MQSQIVDRKVQILYDNYKDNQYAKNAQQEIESLRNKATTLGGSLTLGAFVANEFVRMSSRSPLFKLRLHNVAAVAIIPTLMARTVYNEQINERIDNMWRTHKNRVDKGMKGTYRKTGHHESMKQDFNMQLPNSGINVASLIDGRIEDVHFDNPFLRWHKSFEQYESFLSDIDDIPMVITDEYERLKKYKPDKRNTVGDSPVIPRQDNDEALEFYDIQGEGCFTNPPNPNVPHIDHGQDENAIWAFHRTLYNQEVIKNTWVPGQTNSFQDSFAPWWGKKLMMPAFYKRDKMDKFYRQWNSRLGLETLKIQQMNKYGLFPTPEQKDAITNELESYVQSCEDFEKSQKYNDVYVTDHKPVEKKVISNTEEEDAELYQYNQSVEDYNNDSSSVTVFGVRNGKYERGTLLQRALDPFSGAGRDENGTIILEVNDKDLAHEGLDSEEGLRAEYSNLNSKDDVWDVDGEDENQIRIDLLEELENGKTDFEIKNFESILNKQLGIFPDGKYDFVGDLKDAYKSSLSTSTEAKIFNNIPSHAFWDIKTPQQDKSLIRMNRYNPFRGREFDNFFEMRDSEEYIHRQHVKNNINDSISTHRRY